MAIVTLKKYLSDDKTDTRHVMTVLLNGIATTAIRSDVEEYNRFAAVLDNIAEATAKDSTIEELLETAGTAVEALHSYNQRTSVFVRRQSTELRKVIGMLTESVITITGSSERSAGALEEIKGTLMGASGLEDLQLVKARLSACLEQVCQESVRRREDAEKTIATLENHIRRAEANLKSDAGLDPVTNLPGRSAAEAALREASAQPGRKYLAALVLDSLQIVNARFGNTVGDKVLAALARHVEANLQPGDALFRWAGPALLAFFPRQCTIDRMRIDLRAVLGKTVQEDIDIGGRSVLIPVSPAWAVFGLVPPLATILKHIDNFVTSQSPKDYV
jgi:GGDEF domain-containing protein